MWQSEVVGADDPLRQGDLLDGVLFPMLKQPLGVVELEGKEGVLVPTRRKAGLVVSQCCDNESGEYLAIAQVQTVANLTSAQIAALENMSAPSGEITNYVIEQFLLSPLAPLLEDKAGRYWVAQLTRVAVFWGPACRSMTELRRARMTPQARADLRTNLSVLWARPEQSDMLSLGYTDVRPEV